MTSSTTRQERQVRPRRPKDVRQQEGGRHAECGNACAHLARPGRTASPQCTAVSWGRAGGFRLWLRIRRHAPLRPGLGVRCLGRGYRPSSTGKLPRRGASGDGFGGRTRPDVSISSFRRASWSTSTICVVMSDTWLTSVDRDHCSTSTVSPRDRLRSSAGQDVRRKLFQ